MRKATRNKRPRLGTSASTSHARRRDAIPVQLLLRVDPGPKEQRRSGSPSGDNGEAETGAPQIDRRGCLTRQRGSPASPPARCCSSPQAATSPATGDACGLVTNGAAIVVWSRMEQRGRAAVRSIDRPRRTIAIGGERKRRRSLLPCSGTSSPMSTTRIVFHCTEDAPLCQCQWRSRRSSAWQSFASVRPTA